MIPSRALNGNAVIGTCAIIMNVKMKINLTFFEWFFLILEDDFYKYQKRFHDRLFHNDGKQYPATS